MKQTLSVGLIALLALTDGYSAVSFQFDYSGSVEFNDATLGATRRTALEEAAATLGGWFNHSATVQMAVSSTNVDDGGLAAASSEYDDAGASVGFGNRGVVGTKIITGNDLNGADPDGEVEVNFFHDWHYGDSVGVDEFDFKSTIIHEVLHAIGFASFIDEDGSDLNDQPPGTQGYWIPFDQYLSDNTGLSLIDSNNFEMDGSRWSAAVTGGVDDGLFFNGANAVAAFGGLVPIYSPNPFEEGSSIAHIDDNVFLGNSFLMTSASDTGPDARSLSPIEVGMLRDLGFSVIPESSGVGFALGFASVLLVIRRRR